MNIESKKLKAAFGIKPKLLSTIITSVLIIVFILLYFTYDQTTKLFLNNSEQLMVAQTQSVINEIETWMAKVTATLDSQRDTLEFFSSSEADILEYVNHTTGQSDAYPAGIYVGTTEGKVIHSSFVPNSEYNMFEKAWYIDGLTFDKFTLGGVYFDQDSNTNVVAASSVLKNKDGSIRGVAAADVYLNSVSSIVSDISIEKSGGVFLIDTTSGFILGHKNQSIVGTTVSEQKDALIQWAASEINSNNYGFQSQIIEGEEYYLDMMHVIETKWVAVAYVPSSEVTTELTQLNKTLIVIGSIGSIILILLIERFIHFIVRPIKKLTKVITTMTDGDFTLDSNIKTKDEIGIMAIQLQNFILRMRTILKDTTQIAQQLNKHAIRSSETAELLSSSSILQSTRSTELSSSMNELSRSVTEVADSAGTLASATSSAGQQAEQAGLQMNDTFTISGKGRDDMDKISSSMAIISEEITQLAVSINNMGESTKEIESIVVLIRSIASETNLLSLNASIEAARAGDAGRGFTIVAEQIGKLADTSTNAVDNIEGLTKNISHLVAATTKQMNESVQMILDNQDVVDTANTTFQHIFETIDHTNQLLQKMNTNIGMADKESMDVAAITQEQSASVEEVTATMEEFKISAEQISDHSKAVANDAEDLSQMAEKLVEHMNIFTI